MTEPLTQRVLAAVFEDAAIDDELVRELALSADAHGELVRLAGVLARLPGDGARAAERRLDGLFDDVASVAASESRVPPDAAAALTASGTQPIAPSSALPAAPPATDVRGPRPQARSGTMPRWLVAGGALAAAAAYFGLYLSPASSPSPAARPPALVKLSIHATPADATISVDGVLYEGNPVVITRPPDIAPEPHRLDVAAPGYAERTVRFALDSSVSIKVNLERLPTAGQDPGDAYDSPPKPR